MKFLLEEPACRLFSNNNHSSQEQLSILRNNRLSVQITGPLKPKASMRDVLGDRILSSTKTDTLLSAYINSSFDETQFTQFCSTLTKRIQACSLSHHATMAITAIASFSEEQTNSVECENTYLSSEDASQSDDDVSSLTTITSNLLKEVSGLEHHTSAYVDTTILNSDIDEISDDIPSNGVQPSHGMEMDLELPHALDKTNSRALISRATGWPPSGSGYTGVAHAMKYRIIASAAEGDDEREVDDQQTLADDDNVSHCSEQSKKIRSTADRVSLNSSRRSAVHYDHRRTMCAGEQLNKQKKTSTSDDDDDDDDDYIIIDQQRPVGRLTTMNNDVEDEYFESARLFDNEPLTADFSDQSEYFDDFRYSSEFIQSSPTSDELITASSTLRQQAIAITKVRCKQRSSWVRALASLEDSSTNLIQTLAVGADATHTCPYSTMNTVTRTSLHKHAVDCNKTERRNGETPAYAALQVNHEPRPIKADESAVSPMSKTNSIHDKDASAASRKTDNFYLIHHQSSLIPIKDLLDQKRNSNIEIIQMDEQECILEIVDGVVTLVPKHKSTHAAPVNGDKARSDDKQDHSVEYETSNHYDSPERLERSSSASSSISTPPLELEPEWEDKLSEASGSNREEADEVDPEPFILQRDTHSKSPVPASQDENLFDLLDVFSTPLVPTSTSHTETNNKPTKNLMDDSLSSVSSYEPDDPVKSSHSEPSERGKEPSPVQPLSKSSSASSISAKDESSPASPSNQSSEPLEPAPVADTASPEVDYPLPKTEPPPAAKPINKARINEFASLLSASVHLAQPPPAIKKPDAPKTTPTASRPPPSPSRSDEQSFSSIRSGATSERDDRESFHTVKSPSHSEEPQIKRPIDARYTEKIDDRTAIRINTSNIKALFEQKISDTNRILSQSNEQLLHTSENKQQASHKKVPVSYGSLKRNLPLNLLPTNPAPVRRQSYQDTSNMSKYTDHIAGTKDMVIEEKKPEQTHPAAVYSNSIRRHNTEEIIRPAVGSSRASPDSAANGSRSESLIAREIRETREKEEELRRQRRNCGLPEDASSLFSLANNDPLKPEASPSSSSTSTPGKTPVKSSSFLSNLDFFVSKENTLSASATPSRRSTTSIHNLVYDTNPNSSPDDSKPVSNVVAQELSRFSNSGIPIVRTSSASNYVQRSSSNQNVLAASNTSNVIQREIEAIRAKEAELRQLGRIQHTSDEHSDPRKYQEQVPTLPKSQSINALATGRVKRDTDRTLRPLLATANGFLQPKSPSSSSTIASVRGKFPSPNPLAPVIRSSNESTDYSKLSSADRLELEKREVQEREQELKKQRHSLVGGGSSVNGDSGNASQDEHDDDQERYSDKIARLKRKENEKAQAPLVRPTRKLDMSQRWEQMLTNKTAEQFVGDVQDDDPFDE